MDDAVSYLNSLGTLQVVGCVGFFFYVWVFASVQLGWMNGNGVTCSVGNVVAASLVGLSLFAEFNLASALISVSWVCFGLIGIFLRVGRGRANASSQLPAEEAL